MLMSILTGAAAILSLLPRASGGTKELGEKSFALALPQ